MGLRAKTISGVSWSAGAQYLTQAFQLGVTVLLMRYLPPEVFGVFAMGLVFVAFANSLKTLGLKSALIQKKDTTLLEECTVFWLLLVFGLLLSTIFASLSTLAGELYSNVRAGNVLFFLSFVIFIGSIGVVPRALLEKSIKFDYIAVIDTISNIISGVGAILLAYFSYGVYSLVFKYITNITLKSTLIWIFSSWRPKFKYSMSHSWGLIKYGISLTGFNIVNKTSSYSDELIIGTLLGGQQLGIYNRSKRLVKLPIKKVGKSISNVIFPAMSTVQENDEKLTNIYLKSENLLSFIIFPIVFGLSVVAGSLVDSLLGTEWSNAIHVIQILCIVTFSHVITYPTGWIYQTKGRTDWMFWWGSGESLLRILGILLGAYYGSIESVAFVYGLVSIISIYPAVAIPASLIGLSFIEVLKSVSGNLAASLFMAAGVYALGLSIPAVWSSWTVLVLQVGVGVGLYWGIAHVCNLSAYGELLEIGKERWNALRKSRVAT